MSRTLLARLLIAALGFTGCDSDDPDDPIDTSRQFTVTVENVGEAHPVLKSGAVAQPAGMGPAIEAGESASFSFTAPANTTPMSGMRLNLATMFVQSNDLYYAFSPDGLDLFPHGAPVSGDQTAALSLYDAGTEGDEEPGVGPFQVIRQPAPNTGPDGEGSNVLIGDGGTNDGFTYPPNAEIIRVTITPQ